MARPRKPIDPAKVTRLAEISCTVHEIAAVLDVSPDTIERKFAALVKKGHEVSRKRCRTWLMAKAAKGDTACIIFLAKAWCGMKESPDMVLNVSASATGNTFVITPEQKKELAKMAYNIRQAAFATIPQGNGANGDPAQN